MEISRASPDQTTFFPAAHRQSGHHSSLCWQKSGISLMHAVLPALPNSPVDVLVSPSALQSSHHFGVYKTLSVQNPVPCPSLTLTGLSGGRGYKNKNGWLNESINLLQRELRPHTNIYFRWIKLLWNFYKLRFRDEYCNGPCIHSQRVKSKTWVK